MWAFKFNSPMDGMRTASLPNQAPPSRPSLRLNTSAPALERASLIRALDTSPDTPATTDSSAMGESPIYKTGQELINMVMFMKHDMSREVRIRDPDDPVVNAICRLCCLPYREHNHTRWHLACCGSPCGRPCLAIALYHDNSHACPFCGYVFPNAPWLNGPDVPHHVVDDYEFKNFCDRVEKEPMFTTTKEDFPLGEVPDVGKLMYPKKRYGCFARTIFAETQPIESQSKESFGVLDLEANDD